MTRQTSDISRFADPLAANISWSPLRKGGAGGRDRRLVKVGDHRIEFRSTGAGLFLPVLFFMVGALVILAALRTTPSQSFGPLILGAVSLCAGGSFLFFQTNKSIFDKSSGIFQKTRRTITSQGNLELAPQRTPLEQIHALQLIGESVQIPNGSSFRSYELNLVLESGTRISIADHGDLIAIRKDASLLSVFLEKPVWDTIG